MTKTELRVSIIYKSETIVLSCDLNHTIGDLKAELAAKTHIPVLQQELSYTLNNEKQVIKDNNLPLKGIPDPSHFIMKNLGKQVRWKHVFYIEYLGPIIILPLLYALGDKQHYNDIQLIALILSLLHFLKREYETAFIHIFSRESMPFKRLFINSLHYWIIFALANSIELFIFPNGHTYHPYLNNLFITLWSVCEFCNYQCHKVLSSFRQPKQPINNNKKNDSDNSHQQQYVSLTHARQIPFGWGFNQISCANYFWEAMAWVCFSLLTRCWTSYLFAVLSIYQMRDWAVKKHQGYLKEFGKRYPKGRKAMFPFLL